MKGPIQSVEVSYLVHATEDPLILAKAVSDLLALDALQEEEKLEGHFGNPIIRVRCHLTGEEATAAVERIAVRLPAQMRDKLEREMGELVDEHSALYLRFDKQCLVGGTLEEGTGDSIRFKVKPRGFLRREGASEFYSKVLLGGS